MSLDFHLSASFDEASHVAPNFCVEYDVHEKLFLGPSFSPRRHPLLQRFRDFYTDAMVASGEIDAFLAEIDDLAEGITATEGRAFLMQLKDLAIEGKRTGRNIYAVCD